MHLDNIRERKDAIVRCAVEGEVDREVVATPCRSIQRRHFVLIARPRPISRLLQRTDFLVRLHYDQHSGRSYTAQLATRFDAFLQTKHSGDVDSPDIQNINRIGVGRVFREGSVRHRVV